MGIKLTVMTLDIDPDSKPVTKTFNKNELTLGRLPSNDVVLNRPEISGIHARLRLEKGVDGEPARLFITDLGSSNGTTVEKNHLRPRVEIGMTPNERIFIGNYVIKPSAIDDEATGMTTHSDEDFPQDIQPTDTDQYSESERHADTTGFSRPEVPDLDSYAESAEELEEKPRMMAANSREIPAKNTASWQNLAAKSEQAHNVDPTVTEKRSRANPSSALIFSSDVRAEPTIRQPLRFQGMPEASSAYTESHKTAEFVSPFGKAPEMPEEDRLEPKGRFHFSAPDVSKSQEQAEDTYTSDEDEFESEADRRREEEEAAKARAELAEAEYRLITKSAQTSPPKTDMSNSYSKSAPSPALQSTKAGGVSISVKVDGSDVRSLNFVASAYTEVRGRVQHKGNPLVGVVVDAGALGTAITQSDGSFSIPKVLEGTDYQLRFSKERFILEPSEFTGRAMIGGMDVSVKATQLFSISGVITHSGQPLGGVEVDGGELGKTLTRDDGSYTFENVPEGREYNLTLFKEGYVFKN